MYGVAVKTIKFECPKYYSLYAACHAHGWKNLAPFSWDDNKSTLNFAALINGLPIDIKASQTRNILHSTITSHQKLIKSNQRATRTSIKRCLGLDMDTSGLLLKAKKVGPEYIGLIKAGAGRLLRAPSFWEDAAKTLFTTNCSWALTRKICESICSAAFTSPAPSGAFPFPSPQSMIKYTPEKLKKLIPIGYRAGFLNALSKRFLKDQDLINLEHSDLDYKTADSIIRQSKGFADYACAHVLILAGHFQEIPVDTVVVSYLKKNHRVRKPKSFINRNYRSWGPYKWWGFKLETIMKQENWIGD